MWPLLVSYWTDQAKFVGACRAVGLGVAAAMQQGIIPAGALGWWAAPAIFALSVLFPAGNKTAPLADQIAAMSDDDKAKLRDLLGTK